MKKIIISLICLMAVMPVQGESMRENKTIRAIMGEASGEGYKGMLAIACAIRNRGTLKGVYGVRAKHIDKEPQWVWDLAYQAYKDSEKVDITNGATHWGGKECDKDWISKMERSGFIKTFEYKNQAFYKEKR